MDTTDRSKHRYNNRSNKSYRSAAVEQMTGLKLGKKNNKAVSQQTGKFLKSWECQTALLISWETCVLDKKQQLELYMKQRLAQYWESSMSKLHIVTLLISLIYRKYYEECWAGWITSWNPDCQEKYQQSDIEMIPL